MKLGTHKHDLVSQRTDFQTPGNYVKPDNQIRACRWRSSCHVCVQNVSVQVLGQTREQIEQTSWSLRALTVFMMRFLSASLSGRMGCLRGGHAEELSSLRHPPLPRGRARVWEEYLTDEREGKQRVLGQSEGMTEHASEMCLHCLFREKKNWFIIGYFCTEIKNINQNKYIQLTALNICWEKSQIKIILKMFKQELLVCVYISVYIYLRYVS